MHAYWGRGYASEALNAVSDYLLESGYYLVECSCNELNKQSSRVMEKAGFKKDGYIANRRLNKDGTYSGVEYYSKTKHWKYIFKGISNLLVLFLMWNIYGKLGGYYRSVML